MTTTFTVRIKSTSFDPQAATLLAQGQIASESPYAAVGQYHTLDLELHRNFTIEKTDGWDSVSKQIVREACDSRRGASAWAVIMQEGLANVAVLMGDRTILRQRVNVSIQGKKADGKTHDKVRSSIIA